MPMRTRSQTVWDQKKTTPVNTEARLAVIEQIVDKLTTEMGVLREENQALKNNAQEPG